LEIKESSGRWIYEDEVSCLGIIKGRDLWHTSYIMHLATTRDVDVSCRNIFGTKRLSLARYHIENLAPEKDGIGTNYIIDISVQVFSLTTRRSSLFECLGLLGNGSDCYVIYHHL
jgi:hypothetical protein